MSLQLPYFVPVESLLESLLNASLQLVLEVPFPLSYLLELPLSYLLEDVDVPLDVPLPFSNLLESFPFSNLLVPFPFSNLLVPLSYLDEAAESNLEILSPLSVLAVLTGLLLYLGREELESEDVKDVLQLGVEEDAPPPPYLLEL